MGEKTIYDVFEEIAEIIAKAAPQEIMDLKAGHRLELRFNKLVTKQNEGSISKKQKDELDRIIIFERFMTLAKIKSLKYGAIILP